MATCVVEGVRWIRVDDGIVVFVPELALFVDLNESAAELWNVLEFGEWDTVMAVQYLVKSYGTAVSDAEQVIEAFLSDLVTRSVITRTL